MLDALASLVAKSMLVADEDVDGNTRYQMLETLCAYARERLDEAGDSDAWRRRHAEHYARFAEEACPALRGPDELAWRRRVRADRDNLRAAVFWALDASSREDRQPALQIIAQLATEATLDRGGGFGQWAERAVTFVDDARPEQRLTVLGAAAFGAYHRGDMELASARAADALRHGVSPDCPNPSIAYIALASIASSAGETDRSCEILTEALSEFDRVDDLYFRANTLAVRAFFNVVGGNLEAAEADARQSLELSRRLGNPTQTAIALSALGHATTGEHPGAAREALEESIALAEAGASDVNLAISHTQLARLRAGSGDPVGALTALAAAFAQAHADGDRPSLVGAFLAAVDLLTGMGRYEPAVIINSVVVSGVLHALAEGMVATAIDQDDLRTRASIELGRERYAAAVARGTQMSYEDAVVAARTEIEAVLAELEEPDG